MRRDDVKTVQHIIQELTPLIVPLKISMADHGDGDIIIDFANSPSTGPEPIKGITRPITGWLSTEFKKTRITIFNVTSGPYRQRTIHHEMMHAMGFNHLKPDGKKVEFYDTNMQGYNLNSYEKSAEDKYMEEHRNYSELDKRMITLLYQACLPIGLSKNDFDKIFSHTAYKR